MPAPATAAQRLPASSQPCSLFSSDRLDLLRRPARRRRATSCSVTMLSSVWPASGLRPRALTTMARSAESSSAVRGRPAGRRRGRGAIGGAVRREPPRPAGRWAITAAVTFLIVPGLRVVLVRVRLIS